MARLQAIHLTSGCSEYCNHYPGLRLGRSRAYLATSPELLDLRLLSIRMAKGSSYISTTLERGGIRSGELFGAITT